MKVALECLSGLELGSFCNIILKYTQPLFSVNNNNSDDALCDVHKSEMH